MKDSNPEHYVYVYIDPRNFEEFYYGMGKGNRKAAHLFDTNDTEKTKRINAIIKAGREPIIKVIAKDLTQREAFFIEQTLIWKLGKSLTNQVSGHFADKFRPHDTYHIDLPYFDFRNGFYYVNVGEGIHRCWEDCRTYGFLSAGQDKKWSDPIRRLVKGDIVAAYAKGCGYVGIGRVKETAVRVSDFKIEGKPLHQYNLLVQNIYENCENEKSEYIVKIDWIETVDKNDAKKARKKNGIYSTTHIRASLQSQPTTIKYLETEFGVNFGDLMIEYL